MLKEKEISNTDKQMKNLMNEYAMVKKWIEKVSNYNYTVDLKNKLAESEEEMKNNAKKIKEMEMEQKWKDIQINCLVKDDKSDAMKKIDFNHQKLSYMQGKIQDV